VGWTLLQPHELGSGPGFACDWERRGRTVAFGGQERGEEVQAVVVGGDSRRRREEAKKVKAEWAESFPWFGMDPPLDRR
jgi:hypothetical protein